MSIVCQRALSYLGGMAERALLGSHMSISGGVHTAFERGMRTGCATMQVFVKNSNRWNAPPVSTADVENYKNAAAKSTIAPVVAHAAYLINLCGRTRSLLKQSQAAFQDELDRCERFGILGLVFHPGSHTGAGEADGIKLIAESLNLVHERTPGYQTMSILETTAGQGTSIGWRFEQLRQIINLIDQQSRIGVCWDTCHLFTAGYAVHTEDGWEHTVSEFDAVVGLPFLTVVHVNDSKKEFGSRKDRHEHIGKGRMGLDAFRPLMNDPRFEKIPKILETDKSEDMHEDVENMRILRGLIEFSLTT
jgi:deoxyribonuclease IV